MDFLYLQQAAPAPYSTSKEGSIGQLETVALTETRASFVYEFPLSSTFI